MAPCPELGSEPEDLMVVTEAVRAARKVRFGVDSGAAATVMKTGECGDYPINRTKKRVFKTAASALLTTEGVRTLALADGHFVRRGATASSTTTCRCSHARHIYTRRRPT